jgi:ketosteroid isomerase-like protein
MAKSMVARLPSLEKMKEIMKTYLELVDSGRYDELFPLLSEKVVYQTLKGRAPIVGASKLIQYYKETRVPGSGAHGIVYFIAEDNKVASFLRMKGVMKDGSKLEFEAVDIFTFEGDKIAGIRTFTDMAPAVSG